jgi:hypothetical protein
MQLCAIFLMEQLIRADDTQRDELEKSLLIPEPDHIITKSLNMHQGRTKNHPLPG